jgi:hypothetical protein
VRALSAPRELSASAGAASGVAMVEGEMRRDESTEGNERPKQH